MLMENSPPFILMPTGTYAYAHCWVPESTGKNYWITITDLRPHSDHSRELPSDNMESPSEFSKIHEIAKQTQRAFKSIIALATRVSLH